MTPARLSDSQELSAASREEVSQKPKVYMIDQYHPSAIARCQELFDVVLPDDPMVKNWRDGAEYVFVRSSYVTASDIESSPNLKVIVRHGVGIDRIDAAACKARGIPILNTPGINSRAVAEQVLALAMSVAREISPITLKQSRGMAVEKQTCSGILLHNKVIGIVGMGNIGRTVAQIFTKAFDAAIIAYDPFAPVDAWPDLTYKRVEILEELLADSDVVTLHVPLSSKTRHMIAWEQLCQMKSTAILINAARGGIVHEADLQRALEEGQIWGVGLDCHETEPPTLAQYEGLWGQRVTSTPHIGAATKETYAATGLDAVQRLYDFLKAEATDLTGCSLDLKES